eukprot:CAMPEP_0198221334 /NCGR_PEP_ID=MMETSP1445-20131203/83277_1 /TAXON_ID=36898 /ORGANISM="Pyramimonas sp., Strain CCMP2087" /LENGTH=117 /DNA_ID=CAMNT_0043899459 /DNA_START=227 /DNA_END=577 /DNA_ORIENTATION=+
MAPGGHSALRALGSDQSTVDGVDDESGNGPAERGLRPTLTKDLSLVCTRRMKQHMNTAAAITFPCVLARWCARNCVPLITGLDAPGGSTASKSCSICFTCTGTGENDTLCFAASSSS